MALAVGFHPADGDDFPEAASKKKHVVPDEQHEPCSSRMREVRLGAIRSGPAARKSLEEALGAEHVTGVEENIEIVSDPDGRAPVLRVRYPEGSISFSSADDKRPLGGASFYAPMPGSQASEALCLQYQVKFPDDFEFVKGGKLPGLYRGEAPSGGEKVSGRNGWSVRLMWRKKGQGELYEYIVNKDKDYGLSVGRGIFTFPRGRWVSVEVETILNTPGRADGIARLWIDGRQVIEQDDIVYRTDDAVLPGGLMFSTFFGGSGKSWATPKDQHVDFSGFRLFAES